MSIIKILLLVLLIYLPSIAFGQNMGGTGWMIKSEYGDKTIILFEHDGTFTYLNVAHKSGNEGMVYSDDEDTWHIEDNKVVLQYSRGYQIQSFIMNNSGDYMSGMSINKKGKVKKVTGELIKF